MPSRRHSSAMLSSPRSPSRTMRIFSSAEKCRRVARRMSLIASSAGCFSGPDFCLIFAPCGYDDPEILPKRKPPTVSKALTADNVELQDAIAIVHLARPAKRNALNDETVFSLERWFSRPPEQVKAVVLVGDGEHF